MSGNKFGNEKFDVNPELSKSGQEPVVSSDALLRGAMEISATAVTALAKEAADNKVNGGSGIDLLSMDKPGTIIWTDPSTGEERYTPPGDRMYSTALIYADFVIDGEGNRKPYC